MASAIGTERVQRQVAPGVIERHQRGCTYARGRRRCSCRPTFRAKVKVVVDGTPRTATASFGTLDEAAAWRDRARADLAIAGALSAPAGRARIPTLGAAARDFLKRAAAGKALTRSRRPYAASTLASYENALRRHVLPHRHELLGVPLEALPADALDARAIQALVNSVAIGASPSLARVAEAALSAVLRDLYERSVIDALPARPVLPPPPAPRDERLSLAEADALIAAAVADDERMRRSLMGPFVALLVNGGLRVSEAIGLTWGPKCVDLDADPPRVTVRRAGTKTDAGARTIGLDAATAAALRQHRAATGRPPNGALVFSHLGRPLTRSGRLRKGLQRVAKDAAVPGGFHLLRHTHGSLLADAGQGGHEIAARLHRAARIVLSAALEPNGQVAVLVHEFAHVHGARYPEFGRAGAEVVAETAAFVALSAAALDTQRQSIPYVSAWADAAPKELAAYAEAVHRIAGRLETALGLELEPQSRALPPQPGEPRDLARDRASSEHRPIARGR